MVLLVLLLLSASFSLNILELGVNDTIPLPASLQEVKDVDYFDGVAYVINNKDGMIYAFGEKHYTITGINLNITHVLVDSIDNRTYIIYTVPGRIVRHSPVRKEAPSIGEVGAMEILDNKIYVGDAYGKVKMFSKDLELEKVVAKFGDRWPYIDSAVFGDGLAFLRDVNGTKTIEFYDKNLTKQKVCEVDAKNIGALGGFLFLLRDGELSAIDSECGVVASTATNATLLEGDGDSLVLVEEGVIKVIGSFNISEITPVNESVEEEQVEVEESNYTAPIEKENESFEVNITVNESSKTSDIAPVLYILVGVAAVIFIAVFWVVLHKDHNRGKAKPRRKRRR